jgi:hypothetical protein
MELIGGTPKYMVDFDNNNSWLKKHTTKYIDYDDINGTSNLAASVYSTSS